MFNEYDNDGPTGEELKVKLFIAQVGTKFSTITRGQSVGELDDYNPALIYTRKGEVLTAESVLTDGDMLLVSAPKDNGLS